jgi:hypothetical protein
MDISEKDEFTALQDGMLSPGARIVYMILVRDCLDRGLPGAVFLQPDLAHRVGVQISSLRRYLNELLDAHVLDEKRGRYGCVYRPLPYKSPGRRTDRHRSSLVRMERAA